MLSNTWPPGTACVDVGFKVDVDDFCGPTIWDRQTALVGRQNQIRYRLIVPGIEVGDRNSATIQVVDEIKIDRIHQSVKGSFMSNRFWTLPYGAKCSPSGVPD